MKAKYEIDWRYAFKYYEKVFSPNEWKYVSLRAEGFTIEQAYEELEWSRRYFWDIQRAVFTKFLLAKQDEFKEMIERGETEEL